MAYQLGEFEDMDRLKREHRQYHWYMLQARTFASARSVDRGAIVVR